MRTAVRDRQASHHFSASPKFITAHSVCDITFAEGKRITKIQSGQAFCQKERKGTFDTHFCASQVPALFQL